jgi:hypothetical protein
MLIVACGVGKDTVFLSGVFTVSGRLRILNCSMGWRGILGILLAVLAELLGSLKALGAEEAAVATRLMWGPPPVRLCPLESQISIHQDILDPSAAFARFALGYWAMLREAMGNLWRNVHGQNS